MFQWVNSFVCYAHLCVFYYPCQKMYDRNLEHHLNTKFLAKTKKAAKTFMVTKRLVLGCLNGKKILMVNP